MQEIKGIPIYQHCNNANDILKTRYEALEAEENKIRAEIAKCEARLKEIHEEYKDLNKAEVNTVLDYVRGYTNTNILPKEDIDSLLCHCQNKLKGNINSIFLTFIDPEEKDDESINSKS